MYRSRSRSPVRDDDYRNIYIKNVPKTWDYETIKKAVRDNTKSLIVSNCLRFVKIIKENGQPTGECILKFTNNAASNLAFKELSGAQWDGSPLRMKQCDNDYYPKRLDRSSDFQEHHSNNYSRRTSGPQNNYRNNQSSNAIDIPNKSNESHDLYGLNENFLATFGIKPPLVNKVFVSNMVETVNEDEVFQLFSNAGKVQNVILKRRNDNNGAKVSCIVEFSHPVEAVQAIAMFHTQAYYGRRILLKLDHLTSNIPKKLPQGMESLGPGLGQNREPMVDIKSHLEIQELKQQIKQLTEEVNNLKQSSVAPSANVGSVVNTTLTPNPIWSVLNQASPLFANPINLLTAQGQNMQSLLQQNALAAMQSQIVPQNQNDWGTQNIDLVSDYSNNPGDDNYKQNSNFDNRRRDDSKDDDRDFEGRRNRSEMVVFNNLPPSVTEQALLQKMREIGEIKFVDMIDQGRALVRFTRHKDAERCVKLFDHSRVDGQVIEVNFF